MWKSREIYRNSIGLYTFFQVSTGVEHESRIIEIYEFYDETLELFKGQLGIDILEHRPYKEALLLREIRAKRYKKEKEEIEQERAREESKRRQEIILRK